MEKVISTFLSSLFLFIFCSCNSDEGERKKYKRIIKNYYEELKKGEGKEWEYTSDTLKIWMENKKVLPNLKIKGRMSKDLWKDWDREMNSKVMIDTIWYDKKDHSVKGYFKEINDFYRLIGKPYTKTERTYWFNEDDLIHELLIYWIPDDNKESSFYLEPILKQIKASEDSTILDKIYPENKIIPSRENAILWKEILKKHTNN